MYHRTEKIFPQYTTHTEAPLVTIREPHLPQLSEDITLGAGAAIAFSLAALIYAVSAYIEYQIASIMLPQTSFLGISIAFILAVGFAIGKILATVFYKTLGKGAKIVSGISLGMLVIYSGLCTFLYVSERMAPDADKAIKLYKAELRSTYEQNLVDHNGKFDREEALLRDRYQHLLIQQSADLKVEIAHHKALRDKEYKNEVRGVREGPMYQYHDKNLSKAETRLKKINDRLSRKMSADIKRLEGRRNAARMPLEENYQNDIAAIDPESFRHVPQAQNKLMNAVEMVNDSLNVKIQPLAVSLVLALLIMLAIELLCISSVSAGVDYFKRAA